MENTEQKSNQEAFIKDQAGGRAPSVNINTVEPQNNKANPNMVMAVVLCFMLIIGLGVAFFLNLGGSSNREDEPKLTKKEALQKMIETEQNSSSMDLRASSIALEGRIASILKNAHDIQSEFESMKVGYSDAMSKLSQFENVAKGNINTISRLGGENSDLKRQLQQLEAIAGNAKAYQQQAQSYAQSIVGKDALIANLQGRPSSESLQELRRVLSSEQVAKNEALQKVEDLERKMRFMVDSSEVDKLSDLRIDNDKLRRQLQALQTKMDYSRLFVKSSDDLPAKAKALYAKLRGLEGSSEDDLIEAYSNISRDLRANNLQRVKFNTGSSILNFTDQTKIKNKLDQTSPTDYFLVVGYASKSGGAASNRKLSANRATAVASVVNQLKRSGQDVRAVYLGQTDRFSKSINANNQVCEIWRMSN